MTGVLPAAADESVRDLFRFLAATGLRCAELVWLTKDDVVLCGAEPHVKARSKVCPVTNQAWTPKYGTERVVPLGEETLAIAVKAAAASSGPWAFAAPDGGERGTGRWPPQRLRRARAGAEKVAGVSRGNLHTFRHACCAFLLQRGTSRSTPSAC